MEMRKPKHKSETRYGKWWYAPHHRVKRFVSRVVYHLSCCALRPKRRHPKIPIADVRRILITRYDVLGDMVVTMPLISAFYDANPAVKIDVIASTRNKFLIENDRRIHQIFLFEETVAFWLNLWRLRENDYDLIFSFIDRKPLRQALIAHIAGNKRTLSVSIMRPTKYRGLFDKTVRLAGQFTTHIAPRNLNLAAQTVEFGKDILNTPIRLDYEPSAAVAKFLESMSLHSKTFLVVNVSAGRDATKWTTEKFIELIAALRRRYTHPIVVVSAPPDAAQAADIVATVNDARVVLFPPTPDIFEIVELLASSLALITPDTGIVHLASAAQTPTVALYTNLQSGKTAEWTPYQVPYRLALAPEDEPVAEISVQSVLDAVSELLCEASSANSIEPLPQQ